MKKNATLGSVNKVFFSLVSIVFFTFGFSHAAWADCDTDYQQCVDSADGVCSVYTGAQKDVCIQEENIKCLDAQTVCKGGSASAAKQQCATQHTSCLNDAEAQCEAEHVGDPVGKDLCVSEKSVSCEAQKTACEQAAEGNTAQDGASCLNAYEQCVVKVGDACKDLQGPEKTTCESNGQLACQSDREACEAQLGDGVDFEPPTLPVLINPLGGTDENPAGISNIPQLVGRIISVGLGFLGSVALLFFVYGGVLWMTSRGNPTQVQQGTRTLLWAALGIVFVFSSYALTLFIISAIGA